MSAYEDYGRRAGHYDATRAAVGAEIWLGHLVAQFGALGGIRVLDAGCGTGNYALMLAGQGARLTGFDANTAMIAEARAKAATAQLGGEIDFRLGELPDLPFPAGSFDAVMFNQVLHHLEPPDDTGFGRHRRAVSEAARMLRPGGIILINACSQAQMQHGYWYHALIPNASDRGLSRTIACHDLEDMLRAAGFGELTRTVPLDAVLQGEAGLNPLGPLDAAWRAGDSIWTLAPEEELARAIAEVGAMQAAGSLQAFMETHDRARARVGQTTFWCAAKVS